MRTMLQIQFLIEKYKKEIADSEDMRELLLTQENYLDAENLEIKIKVLKEVISDLENII